MKDLYSFHADEKDADNYYEKMKGHYENIFNRCGIGGKTYLTFASGGSFLNIPTSTRLSLARARILYMYAANAKWR